MTPLLILGLGVIALFAFSTRKKRSVTPPLAEPDLSELEEAFPDPENPADWTVANIIPRPERGFTWVVEKPVREFPVKMRPGTEDDPQPEYGEVFDMNRVSVAQYTDPQPMVPTAESLQDPAGYPPQAMVPVLVYGTVILETPDGGEIFQNVFVYGYPAATQPAGTAAAEDFSLAVGPQP